jgi:hypothetical protein
MQGFGGGGGGGKDRHIMYCTLRKQPKLRVFDWSETASERKKIKAASKKMKAKRKKIRDESKIDFYKAISFNLKAKLLLKKFNQICVKFSVLWQEKICLLILDKYLSKKNKIHVRDLNAGPPRPAKKSLHLNH